MGGIFGSGLGGVTTIDGIAGAITLVPGTNITITDNSPSAGDITIAATGGGGGTPGGSNGQLQFNNSGAFGGANITYGTDGSGNPELTPGTGYLTISGALNAGENWLATLGNENDDSNVNFTHSGGTGVFGRLQARIDSSVLLTGNVNSSGNIDNSSYAAFSLGMGSTPSFDLQIAPIGGNWGGTWNPVFSIDPDTCNIYFNGSQNTPGGLALFGASFASGHTPNYQIDIASQISGITSVDIGNSSAGTWNITNAGVGTFASLDLSAPLAIADGGTGQTTKSTAFNALSPMTALGDIIYGGASGAGTRLAGNTTSTKNFLVQTGTGSASAAPAWGTIAGTDVPWTSATATTITSTSADALAVGANGTANPVLQVDASTSSVATGWAVKGAAANSGATLTVISSATNEAGTISSKGGSNLALQGGSSGNVLLRPGGSTTVTASSSAFAVAAAAASSAAATVRFSVTGAADVNLTASTEAPSAYFNMGQTRQHATGALALQRDFRITGSTHSFVGASTLTYAAAFSVDGAPIGGTNATITTSTGIYVPTIALSNVTNGYGMDIVAPTGAATINAACRFSDGTNTVRFGDGTYAINAIAGGILIAGASTFSSTLQASSFSTGTAAWTLGAYSASIPVATGYVEVIIAGTPYYLSASTSP